MLATTNLGKAREMRALLGPGWTVMLQGECGVTPVEETGATFVENALLKACHAARLSGLPAIADDSGLEVDALGGAPGVRSARFAGVGASDADNVDLLLAELAGVPEARRSARFRCVIAYVAAADDPRPLISEGVWEGRISLTPRGISGFGYDPVFELLSDGRTAAELPASVKNELSHRAQACRGLQIRLKALG